MRALTEPYSTPIRPTALAVAYVTLNCPIVMARLAFLTLQSRGGSEHSYSDIRGDPSTPQRTINGILRLSHRVHRSKTSPPATDSTTTTGTPHDGYSEQSDTEPGQRRSQTYETASAKHSASRLGARCRSRGIIVPDYTGNIGVYLRFSQIFTRLATFFLLVSEKGTPIGWPTP